MADLISFNGGKGNTPEETATIPVNDYIVITKNRRDDGAFFEFYATGFCIFTAAHIAIMRDDGEGTVPVLVVPLVDVIGCELVPDDEDEDDSPF